MDSSTYQATQSTAIRLFGFTTDFYLNSIKEKQKIRMKNWRGWTGLTRIRADQTRGKKDWHECIDYQKEIETGILSGKNQYLDDEFEKDRKCVYCTIGESVHG